MHPRGIVLNTNTFRILIILYLIISWGKSVFNQTHLFWLQPQEIIDVWNTYNTFILDLRALPSYVNLVQVPLTIALSLYGTLGMCFYLRYSREVFLVSTLLVSFVYIFMAASHLSHASTVAIDRFEWILAGAIISIAYFSSISRHFEKNVPKNA
jgi:hypothetical protein